MSLNYSAIKQGDIWSIDFEPQVGEEITKVRPAVVIDIDDVGFRGVRMIVPITSWQKEFARYEWLLKLDDYKALGLNNLSCVNCHQVKSFSIQRFRKKIGELDFETLMQIHEKIVCMFHYDYSLIYEKL
ncbi:type II toxin-antitoxin system PemK/MazF family toxin [Campylobacter helveticus]|uniref:type II toxin-antitoxin system PemK/MazF family toxin n=1 Tax=Campylobacter helveticus TaxID=28898 RepID=UPI0022EA7D74|nr:type II toxin-antitoxin system PemK/MazF family toxin [Campylobacter helveticus]